MTTIGPILASGFCLQFAGLVLVELNEVAQSKQSLTEGLELL